MPFAIAPWIADIPFQQQTTLMTAIRGPDGVRKYHQCKNVVRAYRGTVMMAAARGRMLEWGEQADDFMTLHLIADSIKWHEVMRGWFSVIDELPHHYIMHMIHCAQIIAYKHPDIRFAKAWDAFYRASVDDMHLEPESSMRMNNRLNDFGRAT